MIIVYNSGYSKINSVEGTKHEKRKTDSWKDEVNVSFSFRNIPFGYETEIYLRYDESFNKDDGQIESLEFSTTSLDKETIGMAPKEVTGISRDLEGKQHRIEFLFLAK